MGKCSKLALVFTFVERRGKGLTHIVLSARKAVCLRGVDQPLAASKEVVNRRRCNRALLCDVADPYGRLAAFINDGRCCFQ
jgi:hypothetical protein